MGLVLLAGACSDGTGSTPAPQLTSVSPATAEWGATGVTLTVAGSDFRRESVVQWNGTALATTYVSRKELRATVPDERLREGGTHAVTVFTPEPGGGTSPAVSVAVNFPVPTLASLSVDSATLGGATVTVTATGTGFTPQTKVVWNGTEMETTWLSTTQVRFTPAMTVAGVYPVAARNPAPGGGTSATRPFSVLNPVPVITLLPSYGATAGRPGFALTLHGTGFMPGATARVNGQARAATVASSTRLEVPVSSDEVSAPGTLQVQVVNGGPIERAGNTAPMTVRALGAATASVQRVPLRINDLVWHAGAGRLYLSMPSAAGALGNTVAALDPTTRAVTGSVFVGSEPGRLALSDDGQYLYVGLDGAASVRRVAVPALTAGLQWSFGAGHVAGDLAVVPGQPRNVAVAIYNPSSTSLAGVQLYHDGTEVGTPSPPYSGGARIEFLESVTTLFGYDNDSSGFGFFTMSAGSQGVHHVNETRGLIAGFYTDIVGASGRIYGYDGSVVDAERRVRLGTMSGGTGYAMTVDVATGRAFILADGIRVHDLNTFQLLGIIPVSGYWLPHPAALATRLVRWGTDGLAFQDEDELFIIRSPLVAP